MHSYTHHQLLLLLIGCLILTCCHTKSFAQKKAKSSNNEVLEEEISRNNIPNHGKLRLKAGYFGEFLVHPGVKVGLEYTLWRKDKQKIRYWKRKDKEYAKSRTRTIFMAGNTAAYYHPNNHTGTFLNFEVGYRKYKNKNKKSSRAHRIKFKEIAVGYGYYRYFLHGTTLKWNGDDFVRTLGTQGAFMPYFGFGWGRDFSLKGKQTHSWHVRPVIFLEIPYGTLGLLHYAIEMGWSFPL